MTGRARNVTNRIEVDIERNREDSNWLKVIELAEQLKDRSPEFVHLSDFLIGEGKLENYLEEWPPLDINKDKAKVGLIDAKSYLNRVVNDAGIKAGVAMDAHLLLGKLHYASGNYPEAIKHFNAADLLNLSEKKLPFEQIESKISEQIERFSNFIGSLNVDQKLANSSLTAGRMKNNYQRRSLRIVAESYAVKGLCLQKEPVAPPSKYKKSERDQEMSKCFALASDLALLYMQKLEKEQYNNVNTMTSGTHSPQPPSLNKTLGVILEQALQEGPKVLLQQGRIVEALDFYRSTLYAVEAPGLNQIRLKFMCQMAQLMLESAPGDKYKAPVGTAGAKLSVWKPKFYASINQFVPRNEFEETILLLLLAETIAVRNAVLSQSPEFKDARLSAFQDASTVYDLLTVATVRFGQIPLLQESLERSMKFSFEDAHLWKQHALSLISSGRYVQALRVLKEVIRLEPTNVSNCLLAARLCFEHLNLIKEGTTFSIEAKTKDLLQSSAGGSLLGRCHLYIGIGYFIQAEACLLKKEREELTQLALDNFQHAVQVEPNDHLCHYYLGLQLATTHHVTQALTHVRTAIELRPDSSCSLQLLALLLSAERKHKDALGLVDYALEEYPDCLNLMHLKAHLELREEGGEKALATAKEMLVLWKNLYEGQPGGNGGDVPECDRRSDTRSVFQMYTSEMSDRDSSSLHLHYNSAVSRVEQALSEVASSMSSFSPRPGPQRAWKLQVEIWLLLAELYLATDQSSHAQMCIQEAVQIDPLSHRVIHMKGLLHMHKQEWSEAKLCFQNAVAINPEHVKSLQELGLVYHYMGLQGLAETTFREAAKIDPTDHTTWYNLGKVLEAIGEYDQASDAMSTALMEEESNPILPFNSVPLCFE